MLFGSIFGKEKEALKNNNAKGHNHNPCNHVTLPYGNIYEIQLFYGCPRKGPYNQQIEYRQPLLTAIFDLRGVVSSSSTTFVWSHDVLLTHVHGVVILLWCGVVHTQVGRSMEKFQDIAIYTVACWDFY